MAEVQVLMPKADPNMTEGRIIEWLKKEGDQVQAGDVLANVETEKLEFPIEAPAAGVMRRIKAQAGESVEVGKTIAFIESRS
jgi:pyruvate/2-oxoglutarate dehydrogenase complex dihydrolipoamide acyltransferase (E2) component